MTDETDATVDGGSEATASAEVSNEVDTNAEDTAAQDTGTDDTGQADETGDTPKRKPWWEKRFDELTAKRYDAEREAAYWRGIAEGRTPQQQTPEQVAPPDRWEDPEGYDRWLIQKATEQFAQTNRQQQLLRTYEEREAAARQSHPDFDSVVRDPSLPITPTMAEVIRESDLGPEVAYHLGTNRQEASRIASLPPHMQAVALGKIEAALTKAPPAPAQTRTPAPPPKTVGGISSGINKDPGEMSMAEYVAWMKTRDQP